MSHRLKSLILIIVSLSAGAAGGYCWARDSRQRELYQYATESDLVAGHILLNILKAMDSGDLAKSRQFAMASVHSTLSYLSLLPKWGREARPTPEQHQKTVELARAALDQMLLHRDEWDPRLPSVGAGLNGLGRILSDTKDLQRFAELTNYLARVEAEKR